jgi:hypothetical protein
MKLSRLRNRTTLCSSGVSSKGCPELSIPILYEAEAKEFVTCATMDWDPKRHGRDKTAASVA